MSHKSIKIGTQIFKIKSNILHTKNLEGNEKWSAVRLIGKYNIKSVINHSTLNNLRTNNYVPITRNSDLLNINKIIISDNYDINQINSFQIKNTYQILLNIPFSYILHFSKIKKNNKNIQITIDVNSFMGKYFTSKYNETQKSKTSDDIYDYYQDEYLKGIFLSLTTFDKLYFNLTSTHDIEFSIKLENIHGLYCKNIMRSEILCVNIIDFKTCITNEYSNDHILVDYRRLCGIFINFKCTQSNEPTELQIILNDILVLDYNEEELLKCRNIIDLNKTHSLAPYETLYNYSYSIKFEKYYFNESDKSSKINLKFNKEIKEMKINFIYINNLCYHSGYISKSYQ